MTDTAFHPRVEFNGQDDFDILRMRRSGYVWQSIAERLGSTYGAVRDRHYVLVEMGQTAKPEPRISSKPPMQVPIDSNEASVALANRLGCSALLARQLATDQCSWPQRFAWVARHGEVA